jgi:ATP-binding cassette subfamily B protein
MPEAQTPDTQNSDSKDYSVLLKLSTYLLAYKSTLLAAALALIFTAGVTLSMGGGVRFIIDEGFVAGSVQQLNTGALLIVGIALLMAVGTYTRFYLVSWLGERVSADLRQAVFDHLLSLHPNYFETNRSGEIVSRLTTDTTLLQTVIGSSASMALRSVLTFSGGLIMLLVTNLKLSGLVLACVPLILIPILMYGRRVRSLSRKSQDSIADVGTYAGEIIQQIKTVQSYTQEDNEKLAFSRHVEDAFLIARQRIKQRALLIAVVIALIFSACAGMFWVGGNDVISGNMTAGELGAFIFYAVIVASAVATISEVIGELQRAAGAAERMFELLAVESLIASPKAAYLASQSIDSLNTRLVFDKVTFHYPSRPEHAALIDISLSIEAGQSLALVGPSGAGKSTVFELIQRFYDPDLGEVSLGGVNIKNLSPQDLRRQIAVVAQQPALFSGDVMHNIRYGKPGATQDEVIEAAKAAHAHDFITQLPEGYASYLGEQGVRLSGGQRQRVAIARAILKNPKILLLDEATSALDSQSEYHVQQALETLMRGRTTIIVAHRLSTIVDADLIAVMDGGKVVALGSHAQLLCTSKLYQRLAELQFRDSTREVTITA